MKPYAILIKRKARTHCPYIIRIYLFVTSYNFPFLQMDVFHMDLKFLVVLFTCIGKYLFFKFLFSVNHKNRSSLHNTVITYSLKFFSGLVSCRCKFLTYFIINRLHVTFNWRLFYLSNTLFCLFFFLCFKRLKLIKRTCIHLHTRTFP